MLLQTLINTNISLFFRLQDLESPNESVFFLVTSRLEGGRYFTAVLFGSSQTRRHQMLKQLTREMGRIALCTGTAAAALTFGLSQAHVAHSQRAIDDNQRFLARSLAHLRKCGSEMQ